MILSDREIEKAIREKRLVIPGIMSRGQLPCGHRPQSRRVRLAGTIGSIATSSNNTVPTPESISVT